MARLTLFLAREAITLAKEQDAQLRHLLEYLDLHIRVSEPLDLIPEVREEQPERSLVEVADGELSLRASGFRPQARVWGLRRSPAAFPTPDNRERRFGIQPPHATVQERDDEPRAVRISAASTLFSDLEIPTLQALSGNTRRCTSPEVEPSDAPRSIPIGHGAPLGNEQPTQ